MRAIEKAPWDKIFVHFIENGKLNKQAMVVGESKSQFKLQMYSAIDGHPTNIVYVCKEELSNSERYRLYDNAEIWRSRFGEAA